MLGLDDQANNAFSESLSVYQQLVAHPNRYTFRKLMAAALAIMAQSTPDNKQQATIANALEAAKKAIGAGFRDAAYLRQVADLDALQKRKEYQDILASEGL